MSNERQTFDADGVHDDRVSRAYGDLATERTPEHLDQAVLHEAEKAARPAYKRSILWTKPVAWAAVVAICLAITLQVTQLPIPSEIPEIGEVRRDAGIASADSSDAPAGQQVDERAAVSKFSAAQDSEPTARAAPAMKSLEEAAAPLPEDFEMQDADMLRRAEDMVRQRAGSNKETEQVAVGVSGYAPTAVSASLEADGCEDEDRQDPQAWLVCIVLLERAGRADEAALEREQLAEAFPDFELPAKSE